MLYLYWVGGVSLALFALWFLWNWSFARRCRNPIGDCEQLLRKTMQNPSAVWKKEKKGEYSLTVEQVRVELRVHGSEDSLSVSSPSVQLLFLFHEGQLIRADVNAESFNTLDFVVRTGGHRCRRMLNAARKAVGLCEYGGGNSLEYEDTLAARKQRADQSRAEIQERLNRHKRRE